MAEHTPGPWGITVGVATRSWGVCAPSGQVGVTIFLLADAQLIAAAPELLEALENVIRLTKVRSVLESWELSGLKAIIAKAKCEIP